MLALFLLVSLSFFFRSLLSFPPPSFFSDHPLIASHHNGHDNEIDTPCIQAGSGEHPTC